MWLQPPDQQNLTLSSIKPAKGNANTLRYLKTNAMQQEKQEPILIIDRPDGSQLRLYKELSEDYVKTLIDEFIQKDGAVVIKPVIENKKHKI